MAIQPSVFKSIVLNHLNEHREQLLLDIKNRNTSYTKIAEELYSTRLPQVKADRNLTAKIPSVSGIYKWVLAGLKPKKTAKERRRTEIQSRIDALRLEHSEHELKCIAGLEMKVAEHQRRIGEWRDEIDREEQAISDLSTRIELLMETGESPQTSYFAGLPDRLAALQAELAAMDAASEPEAAEGVGDCGPGPMEPTSGAPIEGHPPTVTPDEVLSSEKSDVAEGGADGEPDPTEPIPDALIEGHFPTVEPDDVVLYAEPEADAHLFRTVAHISEAYAEALQRHRDKNSVDDDTEVVPQEIGIPITKAS